MIATFLLLVAFAGVGLSAEIRCYACLVGSTCNDPYTPTNSQSVACPAPSAIIGGDPACVKIKAGGQVIRSCGSTTLQCAGAGGGDSCTVVDSNNAICCCTGNECNSATQSLASYAAMFFALVLGKLLAGF